MLSKADDLLMKNNHAQSSQTFLKEDVISSFLDSGILKGIFLSCCQLKTSPAQASESLEAEAVFIHF